MPVEEISHTATNGAWFTNDAYAYTPFHFNRRISTVDMLLELLLNSGWDYQPKCTISEISLGYVHHRHKGLPINPKTPSLFALFGNVRAHPWNWGRLSDLSGT